MNSFVMETRLVSGYCDSWLDAFGLCKLTCGSSPYEKALDVYLAAACPFENCSKCEVLDLPTPLLRSWT